MSDDDIRYEYLAIKLPVSVDVIGRLGIVIDQEWPGAVVLTQHPDAGDHLVIRIPLPEYEDEDDE